MRVLICLLIFTIGFSLNVMAQHHIQDTCHIIADQNDRPLSDTMSKEELLAITKLKLLATSCGSNAELASFTFILAPLNGPAKVFTNQNSFSQASLRAIVNAKSGSRMLIERARYDQNGNAYFIKPTVIYIR